MPAGDGEKKSVLKKLETVGLEQGNLVGHADKPKETVKMQKADFTENETRILNTIRARQYSRPEVMFSIEDLAADIIDDQKINLERSSLGLAKVTGAKKTIEQIDMWVLLAAENKMGMTDENSTATCTE